MDTQTLIRPLECKLKQLKHKKNLLIQDIDKEIDEVDNSIKDAVKELNGISDSERTWVVGDVFTTRFFGFSEVCVITEISNGHVTFVRVESIRSKATVKKDYCGANMDAPLFLKFGKTFIHHSEWYLD